MKSIKKYTVKRSMYMIIIIIQIMLLMTMVWQNNILNKSKVEINNAYKMLNTAYVQTEEKLEELDLIYNLSEKYELPPEVILAMMKVESNFNQYAVSTTGCKGIMQISPIHNVANVFGLKENINASCNLLNGLKKESNNMHEVLSKYNRGTTGYYKYVKETNQVATEYSTKILDLVNGLNGKAD